MPVLLEGRGPPKGATAVSAAATDAAAAKEEVKALGKARKYQGCKIWRRYA